MAELNREQFKEWGSRGGKKTAQLGKEHYSKIGKKGALTRWSKLSKSKVKI